jgi:hypothetical protein
MDVLVEVSDLIGNSLLRLFSISINHDFDTLHDGQRDMNVLVRLDVREPVVKDGGKLDLLEHVSSPALLRTS